jgi:hypothetical protein
LGSFRWNADWRLAEGPELDRWSALTRWVRRLDRRRVVDEQERHVMARIVELRNLGKSWEGIALELLRSKVVARTGREWSVSRVKRAHLAEVRLRGEELPGTKRCTGVWQGSAGESEPFLASAPVA